MVFPRPVRAVVFDMDGLLVNTEEAYLAAMGAAAAELGHDYPLSLHQKLVGTTAAAGDQIILDAYGEDFPLTAFNARTEALVDKIIEAGLCLKAGAVELLDELDRLELPRGIATSSRRATVERHLGWSGLVPRFDVVVSAEDYERGKPWPDPFLAAAQALTVDPRDCLALEDSHNGVRAAHAAGMMTVMVPDLLEPTEEMRGLCTHIAESLHSVRLLIGRPYRPLGPLL